MKPEDRAHGNRQGPCRPALRSARRDLAAAGARRDRAGARRRRERASASSSARGSSARPPSSFAHTDLTLNVVTSGKLTWRTVLAWLRDDKILSADDVERTARRFAGGNSAQHPLVRLGSAGLTRVGDGKVLDTETLTEWLASARKHAVPCASTRSRSTSAASPT